MTLEREFGEINFLTDEGRSTDLLPEILKNSQNVKALIDGIIPEIQEIHDVQFQIYEISINSAVGVQLDNIFGQILNVDRTTNESDATYRSRLLLRTRELQTTGSTESLISAYTNATGGNPTTIKEMQPMTVVMNAAISENIEIDAFFIVDSIRNLKQAGVTLVLIIHEKNAAFSFISSGDTPDPNLGFGSRYNYGQGGRFATILKRNGDPGAISDISNYIPTPVTRDYFSFISSGDAPNNRFGFSDTNNPSIGGFLRSLDDE